jgi:SAM-dependent methyltransferase
MIQTWKAPHILKGILTWIPMVNAWRLSHIRASDSDSPRYCYSVWFRHLMNLSRYGFNITEANVGELGPGESLGVGLAALLSGARSYTGLDAIPFAQKADLSQTFTSLHQMFSHREAIPNGTEFPNLIPRLDTSEFPDALVSWDGFSERVARTLSEIAVGPNRAQVLRYQAPWSSRDDVPTASLDLILSQAVLEHVVNLEETYLAMFQWLKPGGYASHVIDFSCHHLSPQWNGHWAYSDWEWRLVKGRRDILLNREPLSVHLTFAKKVGFELLLVKREYGESNEIDALTLDQRFATLDPEDLRTRGAMVILRKP